MLGKAKQNNKDTKNWYSDRYQAVRVQRDLLALISLGAVLFSFVAIAMMYLSIPLVTVDPFVIQVDKKTGITQAVDPATIGEVTAQEAVNQYFVVNYIRARESFGADLAYNYNIVRLMSEPSRVFSEYHWWVNPNNAEGVVGKVGARGTRTIDVKSVILIDEGQAQARATVQERNEQGGVDLLQKVIYLEYEYANLELSIKDRMLNPLGFLVTNYRIENEAL